MSDKTAWEGRDQQLGARIGTVWSLSRALGPAKENNYALGIPRRVYSARLLGAKTEIPAYTSGGSITGTTGQTCTLATFNNGNVGATATVELTGSNTIAGGTGLTITNTGYGSTSAATTATLGNGTATCIGTATIATVLGGAQGNADQLISLTFQHTK